jgi:phage terminase small subunit
MLIAFGYRQRESVYYSAQMGGERVTKSLNHCRLTPIQERAAAEYVQNGGDQSKAYRIANPRSKNWTAKTIWEKASRLFASDKVQARISALRAKLVEKIDISVERIVVEIAYIGLADPLAAIIDENGAITHPSKWPASVRRAVSAIAVNEMVVGGKVVGCTKKVKFWDKNSALEKLMKHLGGFERDNEHKNPFRNFPREQLRALERVLSELELVDDGADLELTPVVTSDTAH